MATTDTRALIRANDVPEHSPRFIAPAKGMRYRRLVVEGEAGRGDFLAGVDRRERTVNQWYGGSQPPAFQPRQDWSHWTNKRPIRLSTSLTESDVRKSLSEVRQRRYHKGKKEAWGDHMVDLWALHKNIGKKIFLQNFGLLRLLHMFCYGIEGVAMAATYELRIEKGGQRLNTRKGGHPLLPLGWSTVSTSTTIGGHRVQKFREALTTTRFLLGIVHHEEFAHWTGYIWDTQQGQLMHYDTMGEGYERRLLETALAWRQTLASLGQPFDFVAFGLPLSTQPGGWECGLLSVFAMSNAVRGLVGINGDSLDRMFTFERQLVGDVEDMGQGGPSLPHRDWLMNPWEKGSSSLKNRGLNVDWIAALVQRMILDEIGIRDGIFINDSDNETFGPGSGELQWRFAVKSPPRGYRLFTDRGGFQPIVLKHVGVFFGWDTSRLIPANDNDIMATNCGPSLGPMASRQLLRSTVPRVVLDRYAENGYTVVGLVPEKQRRKHASAVSDNLAKHTGRLAVTRQGESRKAFTSSSGTGAAGRDHSVEERLVVEGTSWTAKTSGFADGQCKKECDGGILGRGSAGSDPGGDTVRVTDDMTQFPKVGAEVRASWTPINGTLAERQLSKSGFKRQRGAVEDEGSLKRAKGDAGQD